MSGGHPVDLLESDLGRTALDRVLDRLRADRMTGILTVQGDEDIVAISFDEGRIVGADALNETLEDGLGGVLVGEGLLSVEQFESALARVLTERLRLSEALVGEGLLTADDYLAAVRRHTLTLVARSASWQRGDMKFYAADEVSFEEGLEAISVAEVASLQAAGRDAATPVPAAPAVRGDGWPLPPDTPETLPEGAALADRASAADAEQAPDDDLLGALRRRLPLRLAGPAVWARWGGPILVMLLLLVVVLSQPNSLFYPFFWSEPERLEFEKQRRSSAYLKIDRAAKTFFLLEGRFADDLPTLVARGLLSGDDIVGSKGRILSYRAGDRGYVIRSAVEDGTDPGVSKPEAIAGNFFLDPEFVARRPQTDAPPLVLLD